MPLLFVVVWWHHRRHCKALNKLVTFESEFCWYAISIQASLLRRKRNSSAKVPYLYHSVDFVGLILRTIVMSQWWMEVLWFCLSDFTRARKVLTLVVTIHDNMSTFDEFQSDAKWQIAYRNSANVFPCQWEWMELCREFHQEYDLVTNTL